MSGKFLRQRSERRRLRVDLLRGNLTSMDKMSAAVWILGWRQLDSWRKIMSELKGKLLINPTLTLTGILLQILENSHRVTRGLGEDPIAQGAA